MIPCHSQELLPFLSHTFSFHSSPPAVLPSSLTASCHLFHGLPLCLVSKFIYNTLLGVLFSSIICTCQKQHNLCSLIVCYGSFFKNCITLFILQNCLSLSYTGPRILLYTVLSKMFSNK
jgi:hypothetical protein